MSRPPLLILRPEPGASMTAKRAFGEGWRPVVSPIFRIEPIAWGAPPAGDYDALFVTSANAVRQAGKAIRPYAVIPAYAVGDATARALKAAGFTDIHTGRGDAAAMLETAAANGVARALHLAGEDHRDAGLDAIAIDRRIVYRSAAIERFGDKALAALREGGGAVLLHSGRAAEHFARLCDGARISRRHVRIAALAPAVLDAAGSGWRAGIAADKPDDAALLAAAARLCQ
ncbi:Uroporphyrinogen III synthase HEM4 [Rhizorhabdus wittichii RW1]|uniref:Uroporphyrinogen III synthase HEM4 n=1 Tax=Rhizorhabdus wittichii (strain DSM 6014 / CCUG 31198 / JCM 15750 / NBRC 105917 / EY 4224 / RW1) TaxID=392499 RepID=A0A9J9LCD0_RHIWR|nr:uroporphyrinogen-III synthase [Rhizorhabdus wittichii]ABQ68297.1 Uroporphyrinogen III synthase HEM4 [Rhizorhabdus wittichii RW1]